MKKNEKEKKLTFDGPALAHDILAKRIKDDLSFGEIERTVGIKKSKMYTLEANKGVPQVDTLAAACDWLRTSPGKYFIKR